METRRIKRLPVVRGRKVVGIVSRANLLHALASALRQHPVRYSDRRGDSRSTHDRTGQAAVVAATRCHGS